LNIYQCCGPADVILRPIAGRDSAAEAVHPATSFWISTDSGRLYCCCAMRLSFFVRFPYTTHDGPIIRIWLLRSCLAGGGVLSDVKALPTDARFNTLLTVV
jgi:hypothetical protein